MRVWQTTLVSGILVLTASVAGYAQQMTLSTPFRTMHDSFFENNSITWKGNYRGFNFTVGSPGSTLPAFGSPDQNVGLNSNFAIVGKNGQVAFSTNFSQGYRQALVSQTPSVTIMNGQTGVIMDQSQVPFVTSVTPVVGGFPVSPLAVQQSSSFTPSTIDPRIQAVFQAHADAEAQAAAQGQAGNPVPPPPQPQDPNKAPSKNSKLMDVAEPAPAGAASVQRLNAAQESSAGRPALSVAEAKRLHQQELAAVNGEMAALWERAQAAEEDGKPNVAKIYYQRIAKHATGELQQQARTKLYDLQGPAKP